MCWYNLKASHKNVLFYFHFQMHLFVKFSFRWYRSELLITVPSAINVSKLRSSNVFCCRLQIRAVLVQNNAVLQLTIVKWMIILARPCSLRKKGILLMLSFMINPWFMNQNGINIWMHWNRNTARSKAAIIR